jgi:excisionase family DNA binding protein
VAGLDSPNFWTYNKDMDANAKPYTASELARKAGVTPGYVARLCRKGSLEATKVGGVWIISPEVAQRWLEKRGEP